MREPIYRLNFRQTNVTLNGSGNDTDGTIISCQWSQISGPATVIIVNDTTLQCILRLKVSL